MDFRTGMCQASPFGKLGRDMFIRHSDCDSPYSLTNYTFDYLEREWVDDIDFVICNHPHCSYGGASMLIRRTLRRDWR